MAYHSLAEIYETLNESHARFAESVGRLSEDELNFQPTPEQWSIAQIAEHVAIVETNITKLIGMLLHKAASEGAVAPDAAVSFAPVSIDQHVARSLKEKYQSPEMAVPRGGVSVSDSLAKLDGAQQALEELRPRIETADGTRVNYPHPAFGPLNLYEWLVMLAVHKDRHARQIAAIKETLNSN